MTMPYFERSYSGAAPLLLTTGPVASDQLAVPDISASPAELTPPDPGPSGEVVRHIIIGSPAGVRAAIYALHRKRYVEQGRWTGPLPLGPEGVHLTRREGEVMAYLMRLRSLDALT